MLAALVLAAGAFLVSLTPIADGDIFWHLAAGREMARRHAWLRTDPFTVSAGGRPWADVHWLFQLAAYAVYSAGGLGAVVFVKAAAVAAGALVLARAVARAGGRAAAVLLAPSLLGALFVARHLLLARPVIVTLVMLALYFASLEGARAGRRRSLLALPLLQIVWTNCQGLSALGPALVGAYLLGAWSSRLGGGRRWPFEPEPSLTVRPLALALAGCLLALFVTPYGAAAVALPAQLLARLSPSADNLFSVQVAENVAPFALERVAPEAIAHFKWYLVALAACLLVARRRLYLSHLLILAGFGALALMANRNVLLLYWLATPIAVLAVAPRVRELLSTRPRGTALLALLAAALLGGELTIAAAAMRREPPIAAPTPFHFPTESARRLAAAGASGPIFAPDHWGGYLSFYAPGLVPYIDTRLILHTADEYAAFLSAVAHPAELEELAERLGFRYVALTTAFPDRYLGLVQHLAASPTWRLIFTDGSEVLFARAGDAVSLDDPVALSAIEAGLAARFAARPELHEAARLSLARLLVVTGETRQARRALAGSGARAAAQLRARALLVEGRPAAAETLARVLLTDDQHDPRSLALLAQIAAQGGRRESALGWLRRALDADPYDVEARQLAEQLADGSAGGEAARAP